MGSGESWLAPFSWHPDLPLTTLFPGRAERPGRPWYTAPALDPLWTLRPPQAGRALRPRPPHLSRYSWEALLARLARRPRPADPATLAQGSRAPGRATLSPFTGLTGGAVRGALCGRRLAETAVGQLLACLPLDTLRVAGHDHPLEIDGHGPRRASLLGHQDLPVKVDPGVHIFQRLFANTLAVRVEEYLVAEDAKVNLLPLAALVGEDLDFRNINYLFTYYYSVQLD